MSAFFIEFWNQVSMAKASTWVPALILLVLFGFLAWVMFKAQKRPDFDVANFLRDENNKESAIRAWGFVCLGLSSWVIATLTFQERMTENYLLYYMAVWAGTPALVLFASKWSGNLPFAQPNQNPPPPAQPTAEPPPNGIAPG